MSILAIFLISVGLCMDNLAVSVAAGCCGRDISSRTIIKVALVFSLAHIVMLSLGWLGGASVGRFIDSFDHWVAFILLGAIGAKMIIESFSKEDACATSKYDFTNLSTLIVLSVASSIDAFAVGIAFSLLEASWPITITILGLCVIFTTVLGFIAGSKLGQKFGKRMELAGGLILLLLGIKILLEGLK